MKKRLSWFMSLLLVVVGMAIFDVPIARATFETSIVYDTIPNPLPPNMPSLGFEASQISEFGDYVHLAGTNRALKTVNVTMSDGALNSSYPSMPAAGWSHPITLNIYNAVPGTPLNKVGSLLATVTQTFTIPWRPEADPTCTPVTAYRAVDGRCYSGIAFNIAFDFDSLHVTLPNDIVLGVAFNTQAHGISPIGVVGPYNSLNVGVLGSASVGTDDNMDRVFCNMDGSPPGYADGGTGGVRIFREDTGWTPYGTIPFQIIAAPVAVFSSLSGLIISAGTLDPIFDPGTSGYTASVPNAVSSMTLTPIAYEPEATIKVNSVSVASGSASGPIPLVVGSNLITIVVTASDGTTSTYTVTVTRTALSTNALLYLLSTSPGTLDRTFDPGDLNYSSSVDNATTSITVTPTVNESHATVTVNGASVASGSSSDPLSLAVGSNLITIVVTAQDGITVKTYTLTVRRSAPDGALTSLSGLMISSGTLAPTFSSGTLTYTTSVSYFVASVTVTPTTVDPMSTITVNGVSVVSGNVSGLIALAVGTNVITIVVTAQDGTTSTHTVTVTRSAISNDVDLHSLLISGGALTPPFSSGTLTYAASVSYFVASVTVTPTVVDPVSTVTVNGVSVSSGTASGLIALAVGTNVITIVVTAQDGTARTYTVTVTRSALSSDVDLHSLLISVGALTPPFSSGTLTYTAFVGESTTSITVTPTVVDPVSTVTVNGMSVSSGNASGLIALAMGTNVITIVVTAQNRITTAAYTVTVTRSATLVVKKDQRTLEVASTALNLKVGSHLRVTASGGSGNGVEGFVTRTPAVCSVSDTGLVTALSVGDCTIVATKNGDGVYLATSSLPLSLTIEKLVQAPLVVASSAIALKVGESLVLLAFGGSGNGVEGFITTTPALCSVSSSGLVTALSSGDCTIVATKGGDGMYLDTSSSPISLTIQNIIPSPTPTPPITVNGGILPKTGSPWYNLLAIGAGLILLGRVSWRLRRRRT